MASFLINSAAETFNGSDTTDTFEVITGASAVTVNGLAGDDTVTLSASAGTLGDSVFAMGDGDDTFDIATANSTGHDYQSASIRGGEGQDTINIGLFSAEINNVSVNGNEGDDTINVNLTSIDGTASSITVLGGESADTITVTSDDDVHEFYLGGGQDDDELHRPDACRRGRREARARASSVSSTQDGDVSYDEIALLWAIFACSSTTPEATKSVTAHDHKKESKPQNFRKLQRRRAPST